MAAYFYKVRLRQKVLQWTSPLVPVVLSCLAALGPHWWPLLIHWISVLWRHIPHRFAPVVITQSYKQVHNLANNRSHLPFSFIQFSCSLSVVNFVNNLGFLLIIFKLIKFSYKIVCFIKNEYTVCDINAICLPKTWIQQVVVWHKDNVSIGLTFSCHKEWTQPVEKKRCKK